MTEQLPTHSPLGASSAERWMNCPGSVSLIKSLPHREAPDPEYRAHGTAAHEAIAYCLGGSGFEAWEIVGEQFGGVEVTVEMADAIQVFIELANKAAEGADATYIETHLNDTDNKYAYGTIDFGAVHLAESLLDILDFKYGQGIVVETKDNPQMLYYAYLVLLKHPDIRNVRMRIVQPRVPFPDYEPWEVKAEYVMEWAQNTLLPAMARTETDKTLVPGEHCRFCEAKEQLACPALEAEFNKMAVLDDKAAPGLSDADLLAMWPMLGPVKMHIKAVGDEVLRRLLDSKMKENGVVKLVNKKANRVWSPDAALVFQNKYGEKVFNPPAFKSPAEMEKIDGEAKKLVHEYAFTPQSGYTVADWDDRRPAAKPKSATEAFSDVLDTIE